MRTERKRRLKTLLQTLVGVVAAWLLVAWIRKADGDRDANSCWLQGRGCTVPDSTKARVVVLVHGVIGHPLLTWGSASESIADSLRTLAKFDSAAFFAVSLSSPHLDGAPNIRELAQRLDAQLSAANIFSYSEVTFIAHSMGGLVLQSLLVSYGDSLVRTKRIAQVVFLATPSKGSWTAMALAALTANPQVAEMVPKGAFLTALAVQWSGLNRRFPAVCIAETQGIFPLSPWPVVSRESAHGSCQKPGDSTYAVAADHIEIAKPTGNAGAIQYIQEVYRQLAGDWERAKPVAGGAGLVAIDRDVRNTVPLGPFEDTVLVRVSGSYHPQFPAAEQLTYKHDYFADVMRGGCLKPTMLAERKGYGSPVRLSESEVDRHGSVAWDDPLVHINYGPAVPESIIVDVKEVPPRTQFRIGIRNYAYGDNRHCDSPLTYEIRVKQ